MSELIRVLLVEDNQADVDLIREMLPETGPICFRIESVSRLSEALIRLKGDTIDLVLLDLGLPDSQGISTFFTLHKAAPDLPMIILSGNADQELAVTAVKEGAQDYLVKGEVGTGVLVRSARYAIERKRAQDAMRQGIAKVEAWRRTLLSVVEDQKRTQDELRQSEEKFRNVFDNSSIAKSITSLNGSMNVNRAFCEMLGYTKEELARQNWQTISHPDDCELAQKNLDQLQSGERKFARFVKRYVKKDGSIVWADVGTALQKDKNGKPLYFITSVIDITERKRAEETLRVSEERYRTLFNSLIEGFCIVEMVYGAAGKPVDYRFLEVNAAFEAQTGLHDAQGKLMRELAPAHETHWFEIYGKIALTGEPARFVNEAAALGRWFDVRAFRIGGEGSRKVAICFSDITERKRAEDALQKRNAELDAALASMTDAVFISDAAGRFININDAFATFHKFKTRDECSRTLSEYPDILEVFLPDGSLALLDMWAAPRALRGETATNAEYTLRRKDTGETWVGSYSFSPIRDKEGVIVGSVVVGRDITNHKKAENQINQLNNELLQKNAELEQLIYVASHDLRSPLVNVQGFSKEMGLLVNELAEITSHVGLPDKQQARLSDIVTKEFPEARNYILASVMKMDALLKGLLKLSRLGRAAVNMQKIDMDEMLSGVLKAIEFQVQQCGARVETGSLPFCTGDPVQVNQVFTNLIDNAIKYLVPDRPGFIRITGKSENGISEYCVEDNGIGIAPEHQLKVFEIFHRLNPQASEGEGLGLAIVKKVVSKLGGNVRLESEAGKGSRFMVSLPGARPQPLLITPG
jgi:PAS domain S-box-containing protein